MGPPAPISEISIGWWLWIHGVQDVNVRIWYHDLIVALDNERIEQAGWYKTNEEENTDGGHRTDTSNANAHDARGRTKR
jgi:hypothetical protein